MNRLKAQQWDNLLIKSEQLQDKILEEIDILESIEDPCSTEFDTQLGIVKKKMQMLVDLNAIIKLGLSIQFQDKEIPDQENNQITIESMEA